MNNKKASFNEVPQILKEISTYLETPVPSDEELLIVNLKAWDKMLSEIVYRKHWELNKLFDKYKSLYFLIKIAEKIIRDAFEMSIENLNQDLKEFRW